MAFFKWADHLSIGNHLIDSQHQELAEKISQIWGSMAIGQKRDEIVWLFEDLLQSAVHHFETEERIMKEYNFLPAHEHVLEHKKLVDRSSKMLVNFRVGSLILTTDVMNSLKDLYVDHILKYDKLLAAFLSQRKIA
jgi:hemerythrin-like metal-binding protein